MVLLLACTFYLSDSILLNSQNVKWDYLILEAEHMLNYISKNINLLNYFLASKLGPFMIMKSEIKVSQIDGIYKIDKPIPNITLILKELLSINLL